MAKKLSQKGFATLGKGASRTKTRVKSQGTLLVSRPYTGRGQGIGSASPVKGKKPSEMSGRKRR